MDRMTRGKTILFHAILGLLVYSTIELMSFGIYFVLNHTLFSFSKSQSARLAVLTPGQVKQGTESGVIKMEGVFEAIHPYLGFTCDPSRMTGISPYGFLDGTVPIRDFDDNQFIIGILGGSFAAQASLSSQNVLLRELRRLPQLHDKQMIVQTLALGGYKQPQQLLAVNYFLALGAHFDMLINIDGFNEVALAPAENLTKQVSPFYPRAWFERVHSLHDTNILRIIGEISLLIEKQKRIARLFSMFPLRYNITCNIFWERYNKRLFRQKTLKEIRLKDYTRQRAENDDYLTTGPEFVYRTDDDLYESLVSMWRNSSLQIHNLCETNRITYYHFLQPNQYVAGSKILNEEERNIAIQLNHPYKTGAEKGYPYLVKAGIALKEYGVNYYDLTMIFADSDEVLYDDSCCHLNKKGYDIVFAQIGTLIRENSVNIRGRDTKN